MALDYQKLPAQLKTEEITQLPIFMLLRFPGTQIASS